MELLGAVKIQDGLFLGDEYAAQDLEFVVANKVSHVINASARQVPNHWEAIGVQYVDLFWMDHDVQQLLDAKDELPVTLCNFISKALSLGESVLVHSVRGQNRSVVIVLLYLMRTYSWTLAKSLEYTTTRKPNLRPRQSFIAQVHAFESRLLRRKTLSAGWDREPASTEESLLRNTFLNSKVGQFAETLVGDRREKTNALRWTDGAGGLPLVDIPRPSALNRKEDGFVLLRSCLRGGRNKPQRKVPLSYSPRRKGLRKTDGFRENTVKTDDKSSSSTTEDLIRPKRPLFESPESSKKPRALSAGAKEANAPALKNMRSSLFTKPTVSQPAFPKAVPEKPARVRTAPSTSKQPASHKQKAKGLSQTTAPRSGGV